MSKVKVKVVKEEKKNAKKKSKERKTKTEQEKKKASRRGRGARNKGANYEREIAKVFTDELGVEFKRTPQSGGFASTQQFAGDITPVDDSIEQGDFKLHIECKNQKSWQLKSWLRQAEGECPEKQIPTVIFRKEHEPELGMNPDGSGNQANYLVLRLEDFFKLVDKSKLIIKGDGRDD